MTAVATVAGALLVVVALRDVFDTLFHPHGRGVVGQAVVRRIWQGARMLVRQNHAALSLAGPIAFISVIVVWGALVVVGFALMLWPHFPEGFASANGEAIRSGHFWDALYLSMVNLASLGYGDIVPVTEAVRGLAVVEAMSGQLYLAVMIARLVSLYGRGGTQR